MAPSCRRCALTGLPPRFRHCRERRARDCPHFGRSEIRTRATVSRWQRLVAAAFPRPRRPRDCSAPRRGLSARRERFRSACAAPLLGRSADPAGRSPIRRRAPGSARLPQARQAARTRRSFATEAHGPLRPVGSGYSARGLVHAGDWRRDPLQAGKVRDLGRPPRARDHPRKDQGHRQQGWHQPTQHRHKRSCARDARLTGATRTFGTHRRAHRRVSPACRRPQRVRRFWNAGLIVVLASTSISPCRVSGNRADRGQRAKRGGRSTPPTTSAISGSTRAQTCRRIVRLAGVSSTRAAITASSIPPRPSAAPPPQAESCRHGSCSGNT